MGMGGAGTAIAQGPEAAYWNPAGLGQLYNTSGVALLAGARGEFTGGALEGANNLYEINKACNRSLSDPGCTSARINQALSRLGELGSGAQVDAGGAVAAKVGRGTLFVLNETYVGGSPRLDWTNATPSTLRNNRSALLLRGGTFTSIGFGYGHEVKETGIVLGGSVKGMAGKVGYTRFYVVDEDSNSGSLEKFRDSAKTSFRPAVDLGLLWDLRETWQDVPGRPRFALVGRNINNPKFDQPSEARAAGEPDRFSLQGQARAGFSASPSNFWHVAADVDLTENQSYVDNFASRYLSLGTEVNVFNRPWINIPLRAGIQKNLSDSASGVTLAAGAGLNLFHLMFDLSFQASPKSVTQQSEGSSRKIPTNLAAAFQCAVLFGTSDEETPANAAR
jgi:hypothetical protein